ncbi:MAG TPA: ArsA family ATPase, partial [Longimicrobiaceae bacterium]|nr:ArsA family ATPase [Longimicrobiaceae bacterium]
MPRFNIPNSRFSSPALSLGTRWTLVGGKGGVGKTTTAAALAVELARSGRPVLVVSVDPAHSLGDALGLALGDEPGAVPGVPGLRALEVDAERERARFLASNRASLASLLERGTFLDASDVAEATELAVPGLDELAALFRLLDLLREDDAYLVVDTAPTGHALRLLDLPRLAAGWLGALRAMEEKHRAVALALAGEYRADAAADFLAATAAELSDAERLLADPVRTRLLLVTTPEPGVLAETRRFEAALTGRGIALAGIVVNRCEAKATERAQPAKNRAAPGEGAAAV